MKWIKVFFIIGVISFILACCFPLLTFAQEIPIEQKLISLDFENIELVDALRLISAKSDISIIIYPEVKGKVTARFTSPTPVLKVLSAILSPYGFEYVRENNLIIARKKAVELITEKFTLAYTRVEDIALLMTPYISQQGSIQIDVSSNTLVINDTPTQLQLLEKMITSLDAFSPHQEIFQLKYALAEDITSSLKKYLSVQGDLNLIKDKNQILIIDAPYPLDRAKSFIEEIDKFSLQVEEASFRANYLSFDELLALILIYRSAEGKIEVDSKKGIITVEDAAYPLYSISQKVNKEDVFIPDKKTFILKYASATYLSEKVSDLLSDEGQLKVDDVTNALFVVDAEKFIDKITNFIENEDKIENQILSPFSVKDTPLPEVLAKISGVSGVDITWEEGITQRVSASFEGPIPILKALSAILSPYGFEYIRENNLIRVQRKTIKLTPKIFSLKYALAENVASLIRLNLSETGSIQIDLSSNTLVINDTPTQLQLLEKMITSLDAFSPHQEIFQLKYALAEDIKSSLKKYLSVQGDLNLIKDKNQILIIDAPYPLDRAKSFIEEIDKFSLQVEEASFRANYLSFDELLALISIYRSAEGKIEVDSKKGIITVEDAAYPLYSISQKVNKEDVFIPDKKTFILKYASATYLSEKVSDLLSDEGQLKVDDVTNALFVVDAEKFIDKITNFIENEDKIENQILSPFSVKDTPLPEVLAKISGVSGVDITWEEGITQRVSANFEGPIPILKALSAILSPYGFEYIRENNLIRVTKKPLQLVEKTFFLKYALAKDVTPFLKNYLSKNGQIKVDTLSNSILVVGLGDNIKKVDSFINQIDIFSKQFEKKIFSLKYALAENVASLIRLNLSETGSIQIDVSSNTLVINDTPTQLQLLEKMITSLDAFSPHQEIFQLKYALAEDITSSLKKYLSVQGDLNLIKDKNQILIIDAPYPLDRAKSFIEEIDKFSLQVEEASFRANYLSFDELLALILIYRSAEGKIEVDSKKGIITVEDAAYPLYSISQKVNKEDVFIPDKKTFILKYASATYLSEKVSDLLSDEGQLKVDDVTNALFVVDAEKFIDKITNFIENEEKIENQIITKKYDLLYLSVQEAKTILEPVISDFGNVTFDLFLEKKQNKSEDIVIVPQEESSKDVERKETTSASFLFPTVMYVRDLKRNFAMIDKVVQELNSDIWALKMTTRTFYIDKGSVERIALTIANMIGVPIEEVEGLQLNEGGWMQMRIASPTIDLGNIGAIGKK